MSHMLELLLKTYLALQIAGMIMAPIVCGVLLVHYWRIVRRENRARR